MKFEDVRNEFTDKKIPDAWQQVLKIEKMAELLVYGIFHKCLENFSDVAIELEADDYISLVLKSWVSNKDNKFGDYALTVTDKENGKIVLGCTYDVWALNKDIELMTDEMFCGTIATGMEEELFDYSIDIPDEKIKKLLGGIQKSMIQLK